jgi:glycosyltransferase involved in cell wall biosynthesis
MNKRREGRLPSVLMVIEGRYPVIGGGGAESQLRTLSTHLKARGVDVHVCAPVFQQYSITKQTEVAGIRIHRLNFPSVPLLGAMVLHAKLAWYLWSNRHRIDVIHSHIATNMSAVSCVMGKLLGIPVLVKLTGMTELVGGILDPNAGTADKLRRWAMKRATRIQAISHRIAKQLIAMGFSPEQVMYLPNAVDLERFKDGAVPRAPMPAELAAKLEGVKDKRFVALYAGRLVEAKDLDLLVKGWGAVFAGRKDSVLLLAGFGNLGDQLMALAHQVGVGDQVRILGPVEHIEHVLPYADVGILTSRAEGLSNSLLEYMATGLPVVGSCVSGNEDFIVTGETGWLFQPGDEAGLVAALRDAGSCSPEQLRAVGDAARRLVAQRASLPAVLARLCEFYGMDPHEAAATGPDSRPVTPVAEASRR